MKPLFLVGLGALALYIANKVKKTDTVQSLHVRIADIAISCSGFLCTTPVVQLVLAVQNATDTPVLIRSLSGAVSINGSYVGNISSFNNTEIAANAVSSYPVEIRASATAILREIAALLNGERGMNVKISVVGTVNAEGFNVPVDITQSVF